MHTHMRELREKAGLRQVEVAEKMDVNQAAVSKWERGESRPSRKYHIKLAKLYGCTAEELLADKATIETLRARESEKREVNENAASTT